MNYIIYIYLYTYVCVIPYGDLTNKDGDIMVIAGISCINGVFFFFNGKTIQKWCVCPIAMFDCRRR